MAAGDFVLGIFNPPEEGGGEEEGGTIQELETFTLTPRNNSEGRMLFHNYTGEDPGSTAAIVSGSLRLTSNPSPPEAADSIYMLFQPIVSAGRFPHPDGFAKSYLRSGTWDDDNNRLGFLVRSDTAMSYRTDGGGRIEVGTYSKNTDNPDTEEQGRHFYHIFDTQHVPNVWVAYVINERPQHERESDPSRNYQVDPTMAVNEDGFWNPNSGPGPYFPGLTLFYFDPQNAGLNGSIWDFDDFYFWKRAGEPDYDISTIAYCYDGTRYNVFWACPKNEAITYDIRYRTDGVSMKTAGFTSGTSSGTAASPNNDYTGTRWQSSLMDESTNGIYVAIREQGATDFTEIYIPYQMAPDNNGFAQMAD
jgi:hypothetical protein